MERVKWTEINGKRIIVVDFSGLKTVEEQSAVLDEQAKKANAAPPGKFFGIINVANTVISSEFMSMMKDDAKNTRHAERVAVIGIEGTKSVLFDGYLRATGRKDMKACTSEDEAINYFNS